MSGFRIEELASGVYARIGERPLEPNSGIIVGDEGVTLIDTAYSPAAARAIAADIARLTPKPVTTVIISHHHFDHAWGNQVFSDARILGHANAEAAMRADPEGQVDGIRKWAPAAGWYGLTDEQFHAQLDEVRLTPPTDTYSGGMSFDTGGRRVELRHLGPGHTRGDTLVYLPAERLLFGGDLICNHLIPVVGDGDPLNFRRILDEVDEWDIAAIVPGHGALAAKLQLREFAACLGHLVEEVRTAKQAGAPDPRAAFSQIHLGDFGSWNGVEMLPASVRRIYRSLESQE